MSFTDGLSATKTGLNLIHEALALLRREDADPREVMARLTELQGLVLDTRRALGDCEDENRELRRQLEAAERHQAVDDDLLFVMDGGFLVQKSQQAEGIVCPLCPVCWGDRRKLVPLARIDDGSYICSIDHTSYQTNAYREKRARQIAQPLNRRVRFRNILNSSMGS
jgi:hypothetical protein